MAGEKTGGEPNDGFAEFEAAGDVEVGSNDGIEETKDGEKPKKPGGSGKPPREKAAAKPATVAKPAAAGKPADDAGDDDAGEENEDEAGEDEDEDEEKAPKKRQTPSERIRELNKRLRNSERLRLADADRIAALEKTGLPKGQGGGNSSDDIGKAPDPTDAAKYPLGHLDDRYIEDKLEWLATKKAAERADAALHRQQENESNAAAEAQQRELLGKVDDLATRGSEIFDDYQETVIDTGLRGDWRLEQTTFEAAVEAENGPQILYELSQDKKEATRVAGLSPLNQLKFVQERDAEIGKGKQPRRIPRAGEPPQTRTQGANSRTRINPATDNLEDFEKAWAADAKGKH